MIELGGNITLEGFEFEPSTMVIVKKIVGNYAKNIYTNITDFNNLSIKLNQKDSEKEIECKLLINNEPIEVMASDSNLFYALDKSLSMLVKKAKPE